MKKNFEQKPKGNGKMAHSIPPQTSLSPLWTRRQVADALQVCIHSVARYTRAGLLPSLRINRRVVRYDPQAVHAFIQSSKGGAQ